MSIGIDFGNKYSSVSVLKNKNAEIVADFQGVRRIPSFITYANEELIGEEAVTRSVRFPNSCIYNIKYFIGKKFSDLPQNVKEKYSFAENRGDNEIVFHIKQNEKSIRVTPTEAASKIFKYLKTISEAYLGVPVVNAVINIASDTSNQGKQQLIEAAKNIGIKNVKLIKDPVAVCLAYELDFIANESLEVVPEKKILIIDFGESLKVSLVKIQNGLILLHKDCFSDLHADEIDNILYDIFAAEFKRKTGIDVNSNKRSLLRLKRESEKVKRNLSRAQQEQLQIDGLSEGLDYTSTISRARFEDQADVYFRGVINYITTSLGDIPKQSIDDIILIGGCSQIPRLKQMITNYFEKEPLTSVNFDDAVCLGDAIATKYFEKEIQISNIKKTSLPIGIEGSDGKFIPIIPRNSPLPIKITKTFSSPPDTQNLKVLIFEGENESSSLNKPLGQFMLNLSEFEKSEEITGDEHIRLTFIMDPQGTLHVKSATTHSSHSTLFTIKLPEVQ
jgi:molecular chaperone DnaK (HSP70)